MAFGNRLAATGLGALGGAGTGMSFGPIGAGVGGTLGALGGFFGSQDQQPQGNNPYNLQQASRFSPQVQSALEKRLLGGLGQQPDFAPIAQQARQQFQQQTIPSIAERFTSMGRGSLSSPAFAQQLGQAGAGLEGQLAALQSQHGLQQQQLLNQLLGQGQLQTFRPPREAGALESLGMPLAQGLGQGFSQALPDLLRMWQQSSAKNGGQLNDSDINQIIQWLKSKFGGQ